MSFNTASGIYALQQRHHQRVYLTRGYVSIPQAVFTRCNFLSAQDPMLIDAMFQYRKRYLRVATACLESRPQTGLKWQIGKPHRIFPYFAKLYMNAHLASNSKYPVTPVFIPLSAFT